MSANSDQDLRVTRKIARTKATHMSNAKWRKLFANPFLMQTWTMRSLGRLVSTVEIEIG